MNSFTRKQGDTAPPVETTLSAGGSPIDLDDATVEFHMIQRGGDKEIIGAAEVVDEETGTVRYSWEVGDLDTVGLYDVEWEVTLGNGDVITVPNDGNDLGRVVRQAEDDLGS